MADILVSPLPLPIIWPKERAYLTYMSKKISMKARQKTRGYQGRIHKKYPLKSGKGETDTQYHSRTKQSKTTRFHRFSVELPHRSSKMNIPQIPHLNHRVNCILVKQHRLPSFEPMTFPLKRKNYKWKHHAETPGDASRPTLRTNK